MPKLRRKMTKLTHIMEHVEVHDGCWVWQRGRTGAGYGMMRFDGEKNVLVHRKVFELSGGVMLPGMVLDHLCRNPACCNPQHLEQVTHKTNVLRGVGGAAKNSKKTHCNQGHVLAGINLYVTPGGRRQCRACRKEAARKHYEEKSLA